ncbi:ROK family transcriptional regulator [Pseudokineococcus basanitobsidens]|uniref:ROK family transcriptional regulator n=1 Tax=Pseudokineococcus basanitobsidens TaxID=1926649 RepID=A0ABU8RH15_9ACTN
MPPQPPGADAPRPRPRAGRPAPSAPPGPGQLFQLLRDGRPRTRAELAATTGLSRSAVGARVDHLLSTGLVTSAGEAGSTGGRPPVRLAFDPASRVVLAADLGARHGTVELTDLAGGVLAARTEQLRIEAGPGVVLDWLADTAEELLREAGRDLADLVGTGIGVPGPVDHSTGRPTRPPLMAGWDGVDVPALVGRRLPGSVHVDNDVNLMALGEHTHRWSQADHLLFVKVATGIGAGIVSGGRLDRGARGAAGDLGHVLVPDRAEVPCPCGHHGCLEAVAGGGALADALGVPDVGDVVALLRGGDARARSAVRAAGRDLGQVLATCVNLLNPSVIVVGGSLSAAGEPLLAGVREVVYGRSLPLATAHLRIVPSQMRGRAGVAGAGAMVAEDALSPEGVEAIWG